MTGKNGLEIKTGDIVEITGAYFKNDNGLYFVENAPGDPSWTGSDYSLRKISKTGKISKSSTNICFWPISVFVNSRIKAAEARKWNSEHAEIEVKVIKNMEEVSLYFQAKADRLVKEIRRLELDFGENSETVLKYKMMQAHYKAVAERVEK